MPGVETSNRTNLISATATHSVHREPSKGAKQHATTPDDIPLPPGVPPDSELAANIIQAVRYQRIAAQLQQAIESAGITIADLLVAFADGTVALSGIAKQSGEPEHAAAIVQQHPAVRTVSNGIKVQT
jgi:hypothetical protein